MQLNVHILELPFPDHASGQGNDLQTLLSPNIRLTFGPDIPADCEILVAGRPEREQLQASTNLRALIIPWAGLPPTTRLMMQDFPGIAVHNIHHNTIPVSEMAIALFLAASKSLLPIDRAFRRHDWTARYHPSHSSMFIANSTALILGYGAIGRYTARLCHGLGMNVQAIKRHLTAQDAQVAEDISLFPPDALHQLLPQSDVLIISVPQTPETEGMIGAQELALLPSHTILINISRGPIVDEAALYHALLNKTIAAAGLDVWYNYPQDDDAAAHTAPSIYPFHELDNVVMSPHRAAHTTENERLRMAHLAALLNEAAAGQPMSNQVDLQSGY